MAHPTDLENVILGIVAKFGPCTTYTVRRHFEVSPTSYFSASTGSIYPAVRRLEAAGLLSRRADLRGRQRRTMYSITDEGRGVVHAWLAPPLGPDALGPPHDPIRIRMYFLSLCTKHEQREFVARTLADLAMRMKEMQSYVDLYPPRGNTQMSHLAARGCIHATRAQIEWLREVESALKA